MFRYKKGANMSYIRIAVVADSIPGWWSNLCMYCKLNKKNESFFITLNHELDKYNCKNVIGTEFVEFETKEDYLAMVLRWG